MLCQSLSTLSGFYLQIKVSILPPFRPETRCFPHPFLLSCHGNYPITKTLVIIPGKPTSYVLHIFSWLYKLFILQIFLNHRFPSWLVLSSPVLHGTRTIKNMSVFRVGIQCIPATLRDIPELNQQCALVPSQYL